MCGCFNVWLDVCFYMYLNVLSYCQGTHACALLEHSWALCELSMCVFWLLQSHYWWSESGTCCFLEGSSLRYKRACVHSSHLVCIYLMQFLHHSVSLRGCSTVSLCKHFFHCRMQKRSIPNLNKSVLPLCLGLLFTHEMGKCVCAFMCFSFSVFYYVFPCSEKKESRNLVMPVIYLVAYLLKGLMLELFTQPALGESLTHNINLSLWLPANCTVISV